VPDWEWDLGGGILIGISVFAAGRQPDAGGPGAFVTRIVPVPEPGSLGLLVVGTLAWLGHARWKKVLC
jgi:hypothetical protein